VASGKIYNIGNPKNNYSVRQLAGMMLELALTYKEYKPSAKKVKLVSTTAGKYYGKGYQDVQNRVPKIANTMKDLGWRPRFNMQQSLKRIFDAYRSHVADARRLVE
jgi:nucleoside-diphosphate-sugar epimerase